MPNGMNGNGHAMSVIPMLSLMPREGHIDIAFVDDENRLVVLTPQFAYRIAIDEERTGIATLSVWTEERDPTNPSTIPHFHRPPLSLKTTASNGAKIANILQEFYGIIPNGKGKTKNDYQTKETQPSNTSSGNHAYMTNRPGKGTGTSLLGMILFGMFTATASAIATLVITMR